MPGSATHVGSCTPKRFCMCGQNDAATMSQAQMQKTFYSLSHTSHSNVLAAVNRLTPAARDQLRVALKLCVRCDDKALNECGNCMKPVCSFCAYNKAGFCSEECELGMMGMEEQDDTACWKDILSEDQLRSWACVACDTPPDKHRCRPHLCKECANVKFDVNAVTGTIILDPENYDREFRVVGTTIEMLFAEVRRAQRKTWDDELVDFSHLCLAGAEMALKAARDERAGCTAASFFESLRPQKF